MVGEMMCQESSGASEMLGRRLAMSPRYLRHATRGRRDARKLELAEDAVILGHGALALENLGIMRGQEGWARG